MKTRYLFGLPFAIITFQDQDIEVLLDTGFNGSLMLPHKTIQTLRISRVGHAEFMTADGDYSSTEIFLGSIEWFGKKQTVPVVSSTADFALIGMELLQHAKTTINPSKQILTIEKP